MAADARRGTRSQLGRSNCQIRLRATARAEPKERERERERERGFGSGEEGGRREREGACERSEEGRGEH